MHVHRKIAATALYRLQVMCGRAQREFVSPFHQLCLLGGWSCFFGPNITGPGAIADKVQEIRDAANDSQAEGACLRQGRGFSGPHFMTCIAWHKSDRFVSRFAFILLKIGVGPCFLPCCWVFWYSRAWAWVCTVAFLCVRVQAVWERQQQLKQTVPTASVKTTITLIHSTSILLFSQRHPRRASATWWQVTRQPFSGQMSVLVNSIVAVGRCIMSRVLTK
jgi:hypothetical protein